MRPNPAYRHTLIICLVEIFGLSSIAAFPALLPTFKTLWQLSHTALGWISAAYYAGYMIFVPILAGITDRMDARKIMCAGSVFSVLTALGYAFAAQGFWSALVLRFLAGISLAGIYMPGLKLVSDHTEGSLQSRFVSFYTASFSIGASLSYLMTGEINEAAGAGHLSRRPPAPPSPWLSSSGLFPPAGPMARSKKFCFPISRSSSNPVQ